MRTNRFPDTETPWRDTLVRVARLGSGLGLLIVLLVVVSYWPLQSLLVYLGLLVLIAPGTAVEAWDHHRVQSTKSIRLLITLPPTDTDHRDRGGQ